MSDKGIIFSGPMIRALLDGRKTQTRRVLNPSRKITRLGYTDPLLSLDVLLGALWWWDGIHERVGASQAYPYAPGDRLWVREAIDRVSEPSEVWYRADYELHYGDARGLGWRPSIHMPRWASRLTLTVTDMRVQRLQDISEADAVAEGFESHLPGRTACMQFHAIWNSIHGPDAWDANPWVVALSFDVRRGNIDAGLAG